jgi:thioredoxin reductase (NADPH)
MSRYPVDRLAALPNVEVLTETEIVELVGSAQEGLQAVRWRHRPSGRLTAKPIRQVFLFIGAEPATEWLKGCGIDVDRSGFILTGADVVLSPGQPQPSAHETNVPGVFAVGDVRHGSVKRVGAAIGEGANVVAQLHAVLGRGVTKERSPV